MRRKPTLIVVVALAFACSSDVESIHLDGTRVDVADADVQARTEIAFKPPDLVRGTDVHDWRTANTPEVKTDVAVADLSCDPGPAGFGCPCTGNQDCASAWCVLHLGEQVCTKTCVEECPAGWSCDPASGPDPVFVCTSLHPSLCLPCETSTACAIHGGGKCVRYSDLTGAFCGSSCGAGTGCPPGYECAGATTVEGQESQQCIHELGECSCSALAIAEELQTSCLAANEIGSCSGWRVCGAIGLADCDAPEPAPEVCDGIDNDCNGITDEDVDCDDDNECTDDVCNGTDGCDQVLLSGVPCFDDDACTYDDHCQSGECVGAIMVCDDGNVCTDDDCDPAEGCQHPFNQAECDDDGNPCTLNLCEDGLCMHPPVEDGNACNDGDPCSPDDQCLDGVCTWKSIDPECVPCGDGKCVYTESAESCPQDCGWCGDGICGLPENGPNGGTCPKDCLTPCGNGICEGGETADICKVDCGGCGDDFCGLNETHDNCPGDCAAGCGNGQCESEETIDTCPVDCMPPCGDGVCEKAEGPLICPVDCGSCGDGICGKDETILSCPQDCAAACGNGKCEGGEQMDDCPVDCGYCGDGVCGFVETWGSCPVDCLVNCGDGKCQADLGEQVDTCPTDCLVDKDGDKFEDAVDNCPLHYNPSQSDADDDGAGDACDPDDDNDGDQDMTDCAPFDAAVSHLVPESCNGQDDDCDMAVDEEGAQGCQLYFLDIDNDGYGVESESACLCDAGNFYTATETGDCEPLDPSVHPAAVDKCDGIDNDCDTVTDQNQPDFDQDGLADCVDQDDDADGDPDLTDCAVLDPAISHLAKESCDGIDNDCDGEPDLDADCSDGVLCTIDVCLGVQGCTHEPDVDACDDANICTDDACDPVLGCLHANGSQSCDDGNTCTIDDVCEAGDCHGGPPLDCDDAQECTQDWCDQLGGCQHETDCPEGQVCDEGGACCLPDKVACGSPGHECGLISDNCGQPADCGKCPGAELCAEGVCSSGECKALRIAGLGGEVQDVDVMDGHAFVAMGYGGLLVVDMSDPQAPQSVGSFRGGWSADSLDADNGFVYVVGSGKMLRVFKVDDVTQPKQVAVCEIPGYGRDIQVAGSHAFVRDSKQILFIVNIADPGNPTVVSSVQLSGYSGDLHVSGNHVYAASGSAGLEIVGVWIPAAPVPVGQFDTDGEVLDVFESKGYAYLADGSNGLVIVDVGSPDQPTFASQTDTGGFAKSVFVADKLAYVVSYHGTPPDSYAELKMFDVQDPLSPQELEAQNLSPKAVEVVVAGGIALVCSHGDGLEVFELDGPLLPQSAGFVPALVAENLAVDAGLAYVTDANAGVSVFDVSDPASPTQIGSYSEPESSDDIVVSGDYAYLTAEMGDDEIMSLVILDISDPDAPSFVGSSALEEKHSGMWTALDVVDGYVYVLSGDLIQHLDVFDVLDPFWPVVAASTKDSMEFFLAFDFFADSNLLYVPDATGLWILDTSDAGAPTELAQLELPGMGYDVFVANNYTFVPTYSSGMHVVDVTTPEAPAPFGNWYSNDEHLNNIHVAGGHAFMIGEEGLYIVNVSDPSEPSLLQKDETVTPYRDIAVTGGYAYTAGLGGLEIYDLTGCWGGCGICPANGKCVFGQCTCKYEACNEACCPEGSTCVDAQCCKPDCEGKECGSDGCAGDCGTCAKGLTCIPPGECVPMIPFQCGDVLCPLGEVCHQETCCKPNCTDKQCGADGCGGECGLCDLPSTCGGGGFPGECGLVAETVVSSAWHTCATTHKGDLKCWGANENHKLGDGTNLARNVPTDVQGVSGQVLDVAVGYGHSCALLQGGTLECWGSNASGQLGDGSTLQKWNPVKVQGLVLPAESVYAGGNRTCAILQGGVTKCWGLNNEGQLGDGTFEKSLIPSTVIPLASSYVALSTGTEHTLALLENGTLAGWGNNSNCQLAAQCEEFEFNTPTEIPSAKANALAVAAGSGFSCVAVKQGGVKCVGFNKYGSLGDGTTTSSEQLVDAVGLTGEFTAVAAGSIHACALSADGELWCWGGNSFGQVGDGTTVDRLTAVNIGLDSSATDITVGSHHTCVQMENGGINCWGMHADGRLGDGTWVDKDTPQQVVGLDSGMVSVTLGEEYSCTHKLDSGVYCWGRNNRGQLGDGTISENAVPVVVLDLGPDVQTVSAGTEHACALTVAGGVKCWGGNADGQLGNGTTDDSLTPVDVVDLASGVIDVCAGNRHSCAVAPDGAVRCWGANNRGQLGNGTKDSSLTPVAVQGVASITTSLSCGHEHTCRLSDDGEVACWGNNEYKQLGTQGKPLTAVQVTGFDSSVQQVASGGYHNCALLENGDINCWGSNTSGQLGTGEDGGGSVEPLKVQGIEGSAKFISAGRYHTCAIDHNNALWCWGQNGHGQAGSKVGLYTAKKPLQVPGLDGDVLAVSAGMYHTCAVTETGQAWCWGYDQYGQVTGNGLFYITPHPVVGFQQE